MPATVIDERGEIFEAGATAYLRLRVVGFSRDFDGVRCAVCASIGKNGEPDGTPGARTYYDIPEAQLVPGKVVAGEMK